MNNKIRIAILSFLACLLNACTSLNYPLKKELAAIPKNWNATPIATDQFAQNNHFWQLFSDKKLNQLITDVLALNNNLALASLTLKKARLENYGSQIQSILPSVQLETKKIPLNEPTSWAKLLAPSILLNYEIDLFRKLATHGSITDWHMKATAEDFHATALTIIGEVANSYWKIALIKKTMAIYHESIDHSQQILEIVKQQFQVGFVSRIEVIEAEDNVAKYKNLYEEEKAKLAKERQALAILFNKPPEALIKVECDDLNALFLPKISVDLPANALVNRPDVRAAEYNARKALAVFNEHQSFINPLLSLSGTLAQILANPVGFLSLKINLPAIDWKNKQAGAKVDFEKSMVAYRETLHRALLEIENLLLESQQYEERSKLLFKQFLLAEESKKIAKIRYLVGDMSLKDWLKHQRSASTIDIDIAKNRYDQLQNAMTLYRALGGSDLRKSLSK